jgi:hypothetical protein
MATKTPNECPISGGCDCVSKALCRVGIKLSLLVTLALVPFAWDGVLWFADAIRSLFDLAAGVGG